MKRPEHFNFANNGESVGLPGRSRWKALFWTLGILIFIVAIYVAQQGDWTITEDSPASDGSLVATTGVDPSVPREGSTELRYRSADSAGHVTAPDGNAIDDAVADRSVLAQLDHPERLIGHRVTIDNVNVQRRVNDVAFWVGEGDRRLLVVLERDRRTGAERIEGLPPAHGAAPISEGMRASITGTIQRIPGPEGMASWGLTTREKGEVAAIGVYARADQVRGAGHGK